MAVKKKHTIGQTIMHFITVQKVYSYIAYWSRPTNNVKSPERTLRTMEHNLCIPFICPKPRSRGYGLIFAIS